MVISQSHRGRSQVRLSPGQHRGLHLLAASTIAREIAVAGDLVALVYRPWRPCWLLGRAFGGQRGRRVDGQGYRGGQGDVVVGLEVLLAAVRHDGVFSPSPFLSFSSRTQSGFVLVT